MRDTVQFHLLTAHQCGGGKCECECDFSFPADVLAWHTDEDGAVIGATLEVQFPEQEISGYADIVIDDEPHKTAIWNGFIAYQNFAPPATKLPPESGTWTPIADQSPSS